MVLSLTKRFLRPSNLRPVQVLLSQRNFAEASSTTGLTFTFSTPTQVWYFPFLVYSYRWLGIPTVASYTHARWILLLWNVKIQSCYLLIFYSLMYILKINIYFRSLLLLFSAFFWHFPVFFCQLFLFCIFCLLHGGDHIMSP